MKDIRVIDLFSGIGGMSLGFQNAGYNIVAAYDNWELAKDIYERNFKHPIFQEDLGVFDDYQEIIDLHPDMIIGGPPCQDFSSAGKRDESLGRADLTIKFATIIVNIKPKYFVMENVSRVESSNAFQEAKKIFKKNSYGMTSWVLDASLANVPQKRKRFFLFGELNGTDNEPSDYMLENLSKKSMTVRDYLGDNLGIDHYYRHPRNYNRRGIFSIDEPAPTIRGVNRPIPKGYKGHPGDTAPITPDVRALTTIERSYLQTFPPGFFENSNVSKTNLEQMIGNAVPVNLAEHVGMSIRNYIKKKETIKEDEQLKLF